VEDTLVEFLEKGITLESDILSNIKPLLPPEVAQQLEEIIPEAPNAVQPVVAEVLAEQAPPIVYTADNVASSQVGEAARPAQPCGAAPAAADLRARARPPALSAACF
jgi:hypothetical protein